MNKLSSEHSYQYALGSLDGPGLLGGCFDGPDLLGGSFDGPRLLTGTFDGPGMLGSSTISNPSSSNFLFPKCENKTCKVG